MVVFPASARERRIGSWWTSCAWRTASSPSTETSSRTQPLEPFRNAGSRCSETSYLTNDTYPTDDGKSLALTATSRHVFASARRLHREQGVLGLGAAEVLAQGAIAAHDAMARKDQRQRIVGARAGSRPDRGRIARSFRYRGVALRLAVRNLAQVQEHRATEPVGELQIDRHGERASLAGEVLLELARRLVEPPGRAEDPGADVAREAGKDGLMIFPAERYAHEALSGRRQEQRPERAVDGAVRHVEESLPLRQRGEPAVQPAVGVECGGGAGNLLDAIDDLLVGGHDVPFERRLRRLAMPSAALRRAAVALEPRSSPTSAYESSARYR